MVNNMYTLDDLEPLGEYFSITPALRWNAGILEQAWHGNLGSVKWEPVPDLAQKNEQSGAVIFPSETMGQGGSSAEKGK